MYRAQPVSNRLVMDKHYQRQYELHRQKIQSLKSNFTRQLAQFKSVPKDRKKKKLKREESKKIARENSLLLEKLVNISNSPSQRARSYEQPRRKPTLNGTLRKKELVKITEENMKFLERLISKRSHYSLHKWQQDEQNRKKYIQFGCIYPYIMDKKTANKPVILPPIEDKQAKFNTIGDDSLPLVMKRGMHLATVEEGTQRKLNHPCRVVNYKVHGHKIRGRFYDVEISTLKGTVIIAMHDIVENKTMAKEFDERECIFKGNGENSKNIWKRERNRIREIGEPTRN